MDVFPLMLNVAPGAGTPSPTPPDGSFLTEQGLEHGDVPTIFETLLTNNIAEAIDQTPIQIPTALPAENPLTADNPAGDPTEQNIDWSLLTSFVPIHAIPTPPSPQAVDTSAVPHDEPGTAIAPSLPWNSEPVESIAPPTPISDADPSNPSEVDPIVAPLPAALVLPADAEILSEQPIPTKAESSPSRPIRDRSQITPDQADPLGRIPLVHPFPANGRGEPIQKSPDTPPSQGAKHCDASECLPPPAGLWKPHTASQPTEKFQPAENNTGPNAKIAPSAASPQPTDVTDVAVSVSHDQQPHHHPARVASLSFPLQKYLNARTRSGDATPTPLSFSATTKPSIDQTIESNPNNVPSASVATEVPLPDPAQTPTVTTSDVNTTPLAEAPATPGTAAKPIPVATGMNAKQETPTVVEKSSPESSPAERTFRLERAVTGYAKHHPDEPPPGLWSMPLRVDGPHDAPRMNEKADFPTAPRHLLTQVTSAVEGSLREMSQVQVELNPPDLGYIRVEVTQSDQQLVASIEVERPSTHQLLADSLPQLSDSLSSQGINVQRLEVTFRPELTDGASSSMGGTPFGSGQNSSNERDGSRQPPGYSNPEPDRPNPREATYNRPRRMPGERLRDLDIKI